MIEMKKTLLVCIFSVIIVLIAFSQLKIQVAKEGWVTTAVDTFKVTNQTAISPCITITLDTLASNTLYFRTDASATWRTLHPDDASYTYLHSACKYVYRKARIDSVYSRVWAD
jgi:hypothetical protein